jgi:hypothetical protein
MLGNLMHGASQQGKLPGFKSELLPMIKQPLVQAISLK